MYDDFDLANVLGHDEAWNNRGNSALVYESTFMRCVDTWRTPKRSSLFSVTLQKTSAGWQLGNTYRAPLKGTGHVRVLHRQPAKHVLISRRATARSK